jgi:hypothetical protein
MPAWSRILRVLFVAYVAATAIHIGWVVAHEPFAFDAWNVAVNSGAKPITPSRFFEFWWFEYTHSNPRIGQVLTYLTYKLEYFAVIATPLAYLLLSLAITILGIARVPSWRRGRDLVLWTIAIGSIWFALPQVGKTLFCRAYAANYVYSAAIQLWFLVPLRLGGTRQPRLATCIGYFFFGVLAGACNEHSGPTLCAFLIGYVVWMRRRHGEVPRLGIAGLAGAVLGFMALFFAPGQGERYDGLANRVSLVGRFLQRGVVGNVEILRDLVLGAAPVLALIVIVVILANEDGNERRVALRRAMNLLALVIVASIAMAVTIFVSPKLGPRFYYVSLSLLLAGFIATLDAALSRRSMIPFAVLAVAASGYAAARTIPLYNRVSRQGAARIAALEAAKPGSVFVAPAFEQVDESWWYLGDDFRDRKKREMVATYFALADVVFRAPDPNAPLGVAGVRLVPRYKIEPASCLDEHGSLTLGPVRGFDLPGLHREIQLAIDKLRGKLGDAKLLELDLGVELDTPLPRARVLVARWTATGLEAHVAKIERKNRSTTRDIRLPPELASSSAEILVYFVGGEVRRLGAARDGNLHYVPWKTGIYWVLACTGDECFVIAAARHAG